MRLSQQSDEDSDEEMEEVFTESYDNPKTVTEGEKEEEA